MELLRRGVVLLVLLSTCGCGSLGIFSSSSDGNPDPTQPPEATPTVRQGEVTCPVSGKAVDADEATTFVHRGETIYFCCPDCITKFKRDPDRYLDPGQARRAKR